MREVTLYGAKAAGRVALVDDDDYALVMKHRWNVAEIAGTDTRRPEGPYAQASLWNGGNKTSLRMHVLLTGYARTDHIDHNTLNNQRSNLRPATNSQNMGNRRVNLGSTSPFKGVSWSSAKRSWIAQIQVDNRKVYLGKFPNAVEAAMAYDVAAADAWGDYAHLNFPSPAIPAADVPIPNQPAA